MTKTNAVRQLETLGIRFEVKTYTVDSEALGASTAADKLGVPVEIVFKTIVTRNEKNSVFVFCLPGNADLDLKKAARVTSSKRIELVSTQELLPLTGYIRGGCSPIGMKKLYPTYIEEIATASARVFVSAGKRGVQIGIDPGDLARVTDALFVDVL